MLRHGGRPTPRRVGPTRRGWALLPGCSSWWQEAWGLPSCYGSRCVPPLYAVALLAGATRMPVLGFALTVLVGRVTRFVLLATGWNGLQDWLF